VPQRRELHDHFFKKAKAEGYAARSAYKLREIQERYRLILKGDRVLDLGCAPGSWLQVAAELVGREGSVVGIDLQKVTIALPAGVFTLVGDIFDTSPQRFFQADGSSRLFDVVLSDMAPGTTGSPAADHFRSVALCRRVLDLLPALLSPGGGLAMKVFEGETYPELLRECGRQFANCKGLRPEATRDVSREMFIVAKGYAPPARSGPAEANDHTLAPKTKPKGWGRSGP
jgi:23S rRNA (uridine2552-2'-O)-methyltransferase